MAGRVQSDEELTSASSKEDSSKTVGEEVREKRSDSVTSRQSTFSLEYYRHLSSLLSSYIDEELEGEEEGEEFR